MTKTDPGSPTGSVSEPGALAEAVAPQPDPASVTKTATMLTNSSSSPQNDELMNYSSLSTNYSSNLTKFSSKIWTKMLKKREKRNKNMLKK